MFLYGPALAPVLLRSLATVTHTRTHTTQLTRSLSAPVCALSPNVSFGFVIFHHDPLSLVAKSRKPPQSVSEGKKKEEKKSRGK